MPLVKIVKSLLISARDYYDDYESQRVIVEGITDWEEISDSDLDFLRKHFYMLPETSNLILLVKDEIPVMDRIKSIKEFLKKQKEKIAKAEEKKAQDSMLKAEKALEKKKKQFEKLKKELGETAQEN